MNKNRRDFLRRAFTTTRDPYLSKLPWRMETSVKVFPLIPEVVNASFCPGKVVDMWGFNGPMPGPTVAAAAGCLELGRAKGATMRGIISSLIAAILVSGCVAAYSPVPLPVNHPASPAAPEAPPPPPSQAFRDENILPAPAAEAPAQGPHAGHGTMHGDH